MEAVDLMETLRIPHTYCWSPALVPKPDDWSDVIDVVGFFFREPPRYTPPPDLDGFLRDGPPPVYIGFGSIVIDDPERVTALIVDAVRATGVRAIVSRGWSNLGGSSPNTKSVFYLGDCPHEWLFQHVSAVVHHGGAGTTAAGLLNGKPTTIVPFFGDQPFWGSMVAESGAGPQPIPFKSLTSQRLQQAIQFCMSPAASEAANKIAIKMRAENGVQTAVASIHRHLSTKDLKCDIDPTKPAVWQYTKGKQTLKLSKGAASVLIQQGRIDQKKLKYLQTSPITISRRRWDPVTGAVSAYIGAVRIFAEPAKILLSAQEPQRNETARLETEHTENQRFETQRIETPRIQTEQNETEPYRTPHIEPISPEYTTPPTTDPPPPPTPPARSFRTPTDLQDTPPRPLHHSKSHASVLSSARPTVAAPASGARIAGEMALASLKNAGKTYGKLVEGLAVELPLAVTEGFRRLPVVLGGEEERERGAVTGWRSGGEVAVENFKHGLAGLTDIYTQPLLGMQIEGALGFAKGLGRGLVESVAKPTSGLLGLVTYPSHGVVKSLYGLAGQKTRKFVAMQRSREGDVLAGEMDVDVVLRSWDAWVG